jgi:hypothetical protein
MTREYNDAEFICCTPPLIISGLSDPINILHALADSKHIARENDAKYRMYAKRPATGALYDPAAVKDYSNLTV